MLMHICLVKVIDRSPKQLRGPWTISFRIFSYIFGNLFCHNLQTKLCLSVRWFLESNLTSNKLICIFSTWNISKRAYIWFVVHFNKTSDYLLRSHSNALYNARKYRFNILLYPYREYKPYKMKRNLTRFGNRSHIQDILHFARFSYWETALLQKLSVIDRCIRAWILLLWSWCLPADLHRQGKI